MEAMTADSATPQDGENVSESGTDEEFVSIVRGQSSWFGEAIVDVEKAHHGVAAIVVRDDENLNRVKVNLAESDARELVDELLEELGEQNPNNNQQTQES